VAEQVVKQVRLQHLHPEVFHHRTVWNLTPLRDSIAENGVIEPLVVRRRKEGGYWITCGVRRSKAAEMAGLKTVPCLEQELDDVDAVALQVDENAQREGLHPIDEALYYDELHNRGMDHAAIAKRLCVKKRDVIRRMRLLALGAKARKAFVDGRFDEAAAFALASTTDLAKQADVLSALDAGALQPDEISGYVQKTFTAQLDDVPWRMTDEKLVMKAGACSTCPKRSDVQRDLFGADQQGLRCLDVDCWRAKMDATWQRETARPEVSIHEQDADSLFVLGGDRPKVLRSSGMVDADASCPHVISSTWREAVFRAVPEGAEPPSVYLARDQDGRPRFLMRESIVSRLVKKSDATRPTEPDDTPEKTDAATSDASDRRREGKIRRQIVLGLAERATAGDQDTWGWVAACVVESATARSLAAASELLEDSIKTIDQAVKIAGKEGLVALSMTSNRQARRVATAVLIFEEADAISEVSPSLQALAKLCEIDLDAIEREIRKAP